MKLIDKQIADLRVSNLNVRKYVNREELDRLKASILAVYQDYKRLVEPLGIRENGDIIMGSLRFSAIQELIDEGKLPKDIKVPCVLEKELDEKTMRLFSLIENVSVVPLDHSDRVAAIKHLIKEYGDISRVARLLGVTPQTVGRWIALEEEAPLLARIGEEVHIGARKLDSVRTIVEHEPELKSKTKQLTLTEIPRARLQSMAAEAKAGFAIKPQKEVSLAKTYRLHSLFIRDDYFKYLGMYSKSLNKTISEVIEQIILANQAFLDFLAKQDIILKND